MYTAYELSWGDQPKTEEVVMHDEEKYSYDLDGKYTAYKPSWTDKPEVEKAIVEEEQQQTRQQQQQQTGQQQQQQQRAMQQWGREGSNRQSGSNMGCKPSDVSRCFKCMFDRPVDRFRCLGDGDDHF